MRRVRLGGAGGELESPLKSQLHPRRRAVCRCLANKKKKVKEEVERVNPSQEKNKKKERENLVKDPIRAWNAHVAEFASTHNLRTKFRREDGVRLLRLGPRKCEGEAYIMAANPWRWAVYLPRGDVRGVPVGRVERLDGETLIFVSEAELPGLFSFRPTKARRKADTSARKGIAPPWLRNA